MPQPHNRSLCLALGRLRFAIVTSCWLIALCLVAQLVVWCLCTFTEMRYTDPPPPGDAPLIVDSDEKPQTPNKRIASASDAGQPQQRWRPDSEEPQKPQTTLGALDRVFKITVRVARTMGLMGALVICPLLSLGMLLAVPAGAPRVERSVNALIWAIVLVLLAMPLGGWFGLAWQHGTISGYEQMITEVDRAREEGFTPTFYSRFLLLPAASAVGFILVGVQFSSAVVGVLLKADGLDPELEAEAANVAATSLHGTGRTSGALTRALEADKAKKKKRAQSMTRMSPGEMPKRLI